MLSLSCGNSISSALVPVPLASVAVLASRYLQLHVLPVHLKHLDSRSFYLLLWCTQDSEKWLLSFFTLLCLAKALFCREGTRACCQRADNTALIYMLFASVKFSIAAMDPFVFSLHFCFVLKTLITFTNKQPNFFSYIVLLLEFF